MTNSTSPLLFYPRKDKRDHFTVIHSGDSFITKKWLLLSEQPFELWRSNLFILQKHGGIRLFYSSHRE